MASRTAGFFGKEFKLDRISKLGGPLERLNTAIEWNMSRYTLNKHLIKEAKGAGGRPSFDYVMMFKILILQEYFGLSDEQMEFQITDRFSFMRFLGLRSYDKVPDSNTFGQLGRTSILSWLPIPAVSRRFVCTVCKCVLAETQR